MTKSQTVFLTRTYKRVVYLVQQHSTELEADARRCAARLELEFEMLNPGLDELARALWRI